MNAKEAKELALKNQIGTDKALEEIKKASERGEMCFVFNCEPLSEESAMELMKNYDYKISKHTDPVIGRDSFKVEW